MRQESRTPQTLAIYRIENPKLSERKKPTFKIHFGLKSVSVSFWGINSETIKKWKCKFNGCTISAVGLHRKGPCTSHSENDEPCNDRKRRSMSLKALENQDSTGKPGIFVGHEPKITRKLGIFAGREPESTRKRWLLASREPEIARKLEILLQKSDRWIQEGFTVVELP